MKINLSTIRGLPGQPETTLSVSGDVLTVDGVVYDLSPIPEGGVATPEGDDHPFIGIITRLNGEINCTVRVFLGDDAAPDQPIDPAYWELITSDDPVIIPAVRIEEPAE